jgi:protein Hikeshi
MFCVIPANRACHTNFDNLSPTQFALSISSTPHFSHLVVFIIPGNTLPADTAAGVHIQLPGSTEFRFLGAIGNEKPSAIFKVNLPGPKPTTDGDVDAMTDGAVSAPSTSASQPDVGNINLGISVEPLANIQAQLATLQSTQAQSRSPSSADAPLGTIVVHRSPPSTKVLAQRIIRNAFNFLASFAGGQGGQEVVPLKAFEDWWRKFERRIENDPGFLERDEDG